MTKIPFAAYDFFGYLAAGFLVLVGANHIAQQGWVSEANSGVIAGLLWVTAAYIIGQVVAGPSAWLLERNIVGKLLKRPNANLFRDRPPRWWAKLFPGYFTPFPKLIRDRILAKARAEGVAETGEALFLHAFGKVKGVPEAMSRLATFLERYGFCRNISFTLGLLAVAVAVVGATRKTAADLAWASLAVVLGVGLFYRYLKFFRQYSYDLFITYDSLTPGGPADGD